MKIWKTIKIALLVSLLMVSPVTTLISASLRVNCPKILMFDGLDITTQNTEAMAQYWGQTVGVDGFLVNKVMGSWDDSIGDNENGQLYHNVKAFQQLYSKYGVTDNFIKVALYTVHDWRTPQAQSKVVSNFGQAAHLARYAGLKGLALDLEPYVSTWEADAGIPDKNTRSYNLGRSIGSAIISQFPDATIIVFPAVLLCTIPSFDISVHQPGICKRYASSYRFWDGLAQSHFKRLVIATENTYESSTPNLGTQRIQTLYKSDLLADGLNPNTVPIAAGLWPLGKSYTDKAGRITPVEFAARLRLAFQRPSPYIWIYGHGSAWQTDGPYPGKVDPNFSQYVQVLHQVKTCQ